MNVVLVQPEIPPNTGNIARLCVATQSVLHLVEPLGFSLDDRYLKRAGLDYWPHLALRVHPSLEAFLATVAGARLFCFSKTAQRLYTEAQFAWGDYLVFGSETRGLPSAVLKANQERNLRIPLFGPVRSLNLSSAVAVVVYEAIRQRQCSRLQ